jgi:hypothetical protein
MHYKLAALKRDTFSWKVNYRKFKLSKICSMFNFSICTQKNILSYFYWYLGFSPVLMLF